MRFRTVLFDLDGTLLDSREVAVESARRGLEEFFLARGAAPALPSREQVLGLVGSPPGEYFRGILPDEWRGHHGEVRAVVSRHELDLLREGAGSLFPGARDTLEWLLGNGVLVGLVTNSLPEYCEAVLDSQGLRALVHVAFCASPGVTKADMVERSLRELAKPACLVGDRRSDVEAGRAHGLPTLGCLWGYGGPAELSAADHRARDFNELRDWLA